MKNAVLLALCLNVAATNAQEPMADDASCPVSPLPAPVRYERLHQIPTVSERDDVSHRIVTPGGMVLETPRMAAATDVLTIVARDRQTLCFGLLTFSRDRHKCELTGSARGESGGMFLFREGDAAVRFTFLDRDHVRVEPIGTGYRSRCESLGKIEPAIYTRQPGAARAFGRSSFSGTALQRTSCAHVMGSEETT